MTDTPEQRQVLAEILESPDFRDSKRYQDLLRFLVAETLAGNSPKEITIAAELFGKDSSFDPREDPTVRVYMNNLRKKLEHYYLTLEHPPVLKLQIPKGHYQVEFVRIPPKGETPQTRPSWKRRPLLIAAVAVAALSLTAVAYLLLFRPAPTAVPPALSSPIWAEFVQEGGRPTLIVVGDYFFMYERPDSGRRGNFIRNPFINNTDDYRDSVRRNPAFGRRYVQSDFTFLRPSAAWGVAEILPILEQSPNGYGLKLSSQVTFEDLRSNNLIFIGAFKTLYSFQKILHLFGLEYTLSPASVTVNGSTDDSTRTFRPDELRGGNYEKDYSVVAKAPGPNGNILLLLLGFSDAGVIDATRAVVEQEMVTRIEHDHARDGLGATPGFILVLESEGINQSVFKSEIRYFAQRHPLPTTGSPTQTDSSRSH